MTLQIPMRMRYLHERYFGRPSCPRCGELMMAPEYTECRSKAIRHFWMCDRCDNRFESMIRFDDVCAI